MEEKKGIFFAYESGHETNRAAILKAIEEFNKYQHSYHAASWEDMKIGGRVISERVFEEIKKADYFACDLTYLNHNVLFELGFAIACRKKILIFINKSIKNAFANYSSLRIFKNIGAVNFSSHKQILTELHSKTQAHEILLQDIERLDNLTKGKENTLYLKCIVEDEASLELTEILSQDKYSITINDKSEVDYRPLTWYVNAIYKSPAVIVHLLGNEHEDTGFKNAEYSFLGGITHGFGISLLMLAPHPFRAPMDYADILMQYSGTGDCALRAEEWLDNRLIAIKNAIPGSETTQKPPDREFNLLKLGIGFEVAENEKENLEHYFVEMEAYRKAKEKTNQFSIFVGRKGTGKSALFLKLEKELLETNEAFNIILRPEALDLLESAEYSGVFQKESSKRNFLNSIWRFLICGKLLSQVAAEIRKKPAQYARTPNDERILALTEKKRDLLNLNFFALIKHVSDSTGQSLQGDSVDLLYKQLLSEIMTLLKSHFAGKKFLKINLLADNLDKTWDIKYDLTIQTDMLLRLIDYSSMILRDLDLSTGAASINTIIFLREDIFNYILSKSREPDKLNAKAFAIHWHQKTAKLKQLLEERFRYTLHLPKGQDLSSVWKDYFDVDGASDVFEKLTKLILPRPRDHIFFFTRMFESAVDHGRQTVARQDLEYAIQEYGRFLYYNLIAELRAEFPFIDRLLNAVDQEYTEIEQHMPVNRFRKLFEEYNDSGLNFDTLLKRLFDGGYVLATNRTTNSQITSYKDFAHELTRRRLIFLPHRINLILKPQEVIRLNYLREFAKSEAA
jgi:hypothetical protein